MSEKEIFEFLYELGLSRREADVYITLSKMGTQGVNSVSKYLKMDRVQAYRTLKSLQEKGFIETTLETPTQFLALSLEKLIDSYIDTKKSEVLGLESKKNGLVAFWKSFEIKASEYPIPKFRVLMEQKKIFLEIIDMIQNSKKEILELTTSSGVIQEDLSGIFDTMLDLARKKPNIQFRILTNISKENYKIIEQIMKKVIAKNLNIQFKHIALSSKIYPRFIIKDETETILYVTSREELSLTQEDTSLWVSSNIFLSTLRESFLELWSNAIEANERIEEIKTGKPVEETIIIKDTQDSQIKLDKVLAVAEKEIIAITSSDGLTRMLENNLASYFKKGMKLRIMAPIDLDNLEDAQKLSEFSEIRHVSISYITMLIVDKAHLFIFKNPPSDEVIEKMFYLENMFYTNDLKYIERVNEMLVDIWKRGVTIKEISSAPALKAMNIQASSYDTASKIIDKMLQNNVNSVIVIENNVPIGIISEKDILEKILKLKRNPEKTYAKDIMSLPVIILDSNDSLVEATKIMRNMSVQRLAIMKNGKLVGMMTLKP